MHGSSLMPLALQGLEVVKAALPGDLALKVFHPIEGHSRGVGTGGHTGQQAGDREA